MELAEERAAKVLDEDVQVMAHGTFWQGITTVFFKFVSFIFTVMIARIVTQDEVGVFYFALGIAGIVSVFADLGFINSLSRYIPYYLGKKDVKSARMVALLSLFFNTVLPLAFSGLLLLFTGPIAAFFGNPRLADVLPYMAAYIFISQLFAIISQMLTSIKKVKQSSIASNVQNTSKLVLTLALLYFMEPDAQTLAIASILSFAVAAAYVAFEAKKFSKILYTREKIALRDYGPLLREMLPFGLTMILVLFIATIVGYTDRIMLGYYLQEDANSQIAIYTIATGLAGIVAIFASAVINIFFPLISEMHGANDSKRMNAASGTALRWIAFSSVPLAAFFIAFSGPLLRLLYGALYEPGALVLSLFSAGVFFSLLGTVQRTALAGMRMLRQEIIVAGAAALLNLALNILLIPPYGINGAAFASAVSLTSTAFLYQRYAGRLMGFPFPPSILKNILAGVAVLALLWLLQSFAYSAIASLPLPSVSGSVLSIVLDKILKLAALGVFFAIGLAAYVVLLNLMKLFEKEDADVLRKMMEKSRLPAWLPKMALRAIFWNHKDFN